MPVQVALTGATGFIGSNILTALLGAGYSVRALTRKPRHEPAAVAWVTGDLTSLQALQELCRDCTAVIHCAGVVRGNSAQDFYRTNVTGTGNIVAVAGSMQTPVNLLMLSSLAARCPGLSWYARSKFEAEQLVGDAPANIAGTVFRPTAVYGPGDREMQPLFKMMKHGFLFVPGTDTGRISLLHVNDLVNAVMKWLQAGSGAGILELDDGTPGGYDWDDIIKTGEQVWGRKIRKIPVPLPVLNATARINLLCARLLHYPAMLTPGKINEITHPDWVCDNVPITEILGWKPQIHLSQAIDQASHRHSSA